MKIVVCCPSYKRPKVETLDYLPMCKVYVDVDEYDDYVKANPNFEENIISVPKGIQGNVCRIRNYILDKELEENDAVCIIDDDMKGVYHFYVDGKNAYKRKRVEAHEFIGFLEKYTLMCKEFGFYLWGVNSLKDPMAYKHNNPFSTLAFIGAPFSVHLKNDLRYDESLPLKEDYDLTIQHMNEYRGCLRVNSYHYDCKQSKQVGGCATYRNYLREEEQLNMLVKKWGSKIVKVDIGRNPRREKESKKMDYNPIMKIPIKGI